MSSRLRSDFWVSAYIRACHLRGAYAVVSRRGAAEAGAIFIVMDRLDGRVELYGPAPQTAFGEDDDGERRFVRLGGMDADPVDIRKRLERERDFDPDLWIVEVEGREGRHSLELVD